MWFSCCRENQKKRRPKMTAMLTDVSTRNLEEILCPENDKRCGMVAKVLGGSLRTLWMCRQAPDETHFTMAVLFCEIPDTKQITVKDILGCTTSLFSGPALI
jgi:hypothetical protein